MKTMREAIIEAEKYVPTGRCLNCLQPTTESVCSRVCADMFIEAMAKTDKWYNDKTVYEKLRDGSLIV